MSRWNRLLRAGPGAFALAFLAVASHAQKPKEPWGTGEPDGARSLS